MQFADNLANLIQKKTKTDDAETQLVISILRANWFDQETTFRGTSVHTFQRLGFPENLSNAIIESLEEIFSQKQNNTAEHIPNRDFGLGLLGISREKNIIVSKVNFENKSLKKIKTNSDHSLKIASKSKIERFVEDIEKCLLNFYLYEPNIELQHKSLTRIELLVQPILSSIDTKENWNVNTEDPSNFCQIFKYNDLSELFLCLGFRHLKDRDIFLSKKSTTFNELTVFINIIKKYKPSENISDIRIEKDFSSHQSERSLNDVRTKKCLASNESIESTRIQLLMEIDKFEEFVHVKFLNKSVLSMSLFSSAKNKEICSEPNVDFTDFNGENEDEFIEISTFFKKWYSKQFFSFRKMAKIDVIRARKLYHFFKNEHVELKIKLNNQHFMKVIVSTSHTFAFVIESLEKHFDSKKTCFELLQLKNNCKYSRESKSSTVLIGDMNLASEAEFEILYENSNELLFDFVEKRENKKMRTC